VPPELSLPPIEPLVSAAPLELEPSLPLESAALVLDSPDPAEVEVEPAPVVVPSDEVEPPLVVPPPSPLAAVSSPHAMSKTERRQADKEARMPC
jgi:hypothetical protein